MPKPPKKRRPLHHEQTGLCAFLQIVLSELSGQVAGWLLKDAAMVLPQPEDIVLAKPPTTSNMLEMQLSADWLAQHAEY